MLMSPLSRDKASLLASRDKHSVVRSFQDTFIDDMKISKQRASRVASQNPVELMPGPTALKIAAVPFDAEKLAKDAGGKDQSQLKAVIFCVLASCHNKFVLSRSI
jgi:hypothetical protein